MDELLREGREGLRRYAEQTRDLAERDNRARAVMALTQVAPDLRRRYPEMLRLAFERELVDNPLSTIVDTGPSSIRFDQLELMDEQQVQQRISTVRGLQQVLLESELELSELNALVSALMGFAQVRSERNPLRPEVFLEVLQTLLAEQPGDGRTHAYWSQVLVPLLGKQLREVYRSLLGQLRQQRIQPARYAIQRPVQMGSAGPARGNTVSAPGSAVLATSGAGPAPRPAAVAAAQLTVQQLHGLVSGSAQNPEQLAQEVVNLIIANIAGDPRILPPVWQLIYELEPALLALARNDLNFFHDKKHPARLLLEEVVQHSFAYPEEATPGFEDFLAHLRMALGEIDPARAGHPAIFAAALERLHRHWAQAEQVREAQRQAAVQALQQAERRNELARQIAEHIRQQPDTVLVPDVVVDFACGPWAQVMAKARIDGSAGGSGGADHVALLEDLFWSVRPDLTRQQPGQLVKLIPQLVQGLRQGLALIDYPAEQTEHFFAQLFALHQGGMDGMSSARSLRAAAPAPAQGPWLAPEEARDSGFMDDMVEAPRGDFAATVPADFPATEPMGLVDRASETEPAPLESAADAGLLQLDQLQPGSWIELQVSGQWVRLQLVWLSDNASLCLFSSSNGANHSMTRRMFDRLVAQDQLRLVSQGAVVDRAFDAVAELAMRNSVYMDIQADPQP